MFRDLVYYTQLILESAVGVLGIRVYEEPHYEVIASLADGIEVRRYAPRVAAQIEVPGREAQAQDEAFSALFRYIAGANAAKEKLEMTAPVATEPRAEKIAMTVPVETTDVGGGVRMQFFLPARFTADTAPQPNDPRVRVIPVPEETVAVLRFSGRGEREAVTSRQAELLEGLAAASGWKRAGDPVALFYDAPYTVPFLRRNEVAVAVREVRAE